MLYYFLHILSCIWEYAIELIKGLEEKSLDGRLAESTGNLLILAPEYSSFVSFSNLGSFSSKNDLFTKILGFYLNGYPIL